MLSIRKHEIPPLPTPERPAVISAEIFFHSGGSSKQDGNRADVTESSAELYLLLRKVDVLNLAPAHFLFEGLLKAKKDKLVKVFVWILSVSNTLTLCFSSSLSVQPCSALSCTVGGVGGVPSKQHYLFTPLPREEFKTKTWNAHLEIPFFPSLLPSPPPVVPRRGELRVTQSILSVWPARLRPSMLI